MSMLCCLYRISPDQLVRLKAFPDAVGELLGLTSPAPAQVGFLSKLFGKQAAQTAPSERKFEAIAEHDIFELNQAWHILHFLFSGSQAQGKWPAAFLVDGGEEIGPDQGYGPARLLAPELSRDIATFLNTQSFKTLAAAYVASEIEAAEIYWQAAPEPRERQRQVEELWSVASELRTFFERTALAGSATLVSIY